MGRQGGVGGWWGGTDRAGRGHGTTGRGFLFPYWCFDRRELGYGMSLMTSVVHQPYGHTFP